MKLKTKIRAGAVLLLVPLLAFFIYACGGSDDGDGGTEVASTESTSEASGGGECKELNLLTWEGYAEPSVVEPFQEEHGVTVNATYVGSDAELVSKAGIDKGRYQIVNVGGATRARMIEAGAVQPLDISRLEHWDEAYEELKAPYEVDGEYWGFPDAWAINPFLFDTEVLPEAPATLEEALWNPALKGRLALWNEVSIIYLGASVLGFDKEQEDQSAEGGVFNLTDEQLEQIKEKMLTLKPQVRAVWSTGGDLIQLFSNGEVDGSPGWNYIYENLKSENFPVGQARYGDAGAAWVDGVGVGADISEDCVDLAYEWINWVTSPENQATLAKDTGYGVANKNAIEFMDEGLIEQTMMDQAEELLPKQILRLDPVRPDVYQKYTEEIVAGLQ